MAFTFGRRIVQNLTKLTTTSPPLSRCFTKSHGRYRFINFMTQNTRATSNLATAVLSFGLAGGAVCFWQTRYPTQGPLAVRAAHDDSPCGPKPAASKSCKGGKESKGRLKVPGPCQPRKKKMTPEPQKNVISGLKKYSLFLWITLEADADPCVVACAAAQIEEAIAATKGHDCDVDDEILAGVGFGPNFLCQNCMSPSKNFCYHTRKGKRGEMPSSNGDIFVHAKADSLGQLFDFCKTYLHNFPDDSVCEFEDLYGFSFRGTRDISGFAINQTNRCKEEGLREVALDEETAGSYALAQKWVHDLCALDEEQATLEGYIGRKLDTGEELPERTVSSHVTRMSGNSEPGCRPKHEVVQQAMSYGSLSERAGMFFLGFSKDPCTFDYMLDRMVGANCDDGEHDDVMRISKNVKGTYFYFPGLKEVESMKADA